MSGAIQYTYWRYAGTKSIRYFNCPILIVYADDFRSADAQFKQITGTDPGRLVHIGCRVWPVVAAPPSFPPPQKDAP